MNLVEKIINDNSLNWCYNNLSIRFNKQQLSILRDKSDKRFYNLKRRTGKTLLICSEALNYAFNHSNKNVVICICNLTEKNYIKNMLINLIEQSTNLMEEFESHNNSHLYLKNGTVITLFYQRDSFLKGMKVDYLLIDNFEYFSIETINHLLTCIKEDSSRVLILGTDNNNNRMEMIINESN